LGPLAEWADADRAVRALSDLIGRLRTRHLFLSYSSEGVVPNRSIWELLKTRGRPECFEFEHAGAAPGGRVVDRLFYCELQPPSA
jgi:adenine-specific DNA methylase